MNLEQEIKQAREALEKLIAKAEQKKESMFPEVRKFERYYFVSVGGVVGNETNDNYPFDLNHARTGNIFPTSQKKQAEACAEYLKDNFWFIRKAIEFADGYEFWQGGKNWYLMYDCACRKWRILNYVVCTSPTDIHMSKEAAEKFKEWLEIHKPNGV